MAAIKASTLVLGNGTVSTVAPSRMTVTRSPMAKISGMRCEMYTTETPRARSGRE